MKWQTHLRIAEWIGSELNFSKPELLKLAQGSIAPDKWWDHSFHHNHKYLDRKIIERIVRARKLFLNQGRVARGQATYPFFELGIALHYIVDRLVPQTSYLRHIEIEEEIDKISQSRREGKHKWSKEEYKKHIEETRKEIEGLELREEEKTLLLDPGWTRGKKNTLTLALTNLPTNIDSNLLFHIASRISIGVTLSIMSKAPPPMLLWEKYNFATKSISKNIPKFIYHSIFVIVLPFLFLAYEGVGGIGYLLTLLLNLLVLIPIVSILRKDNNFKAYLNFRERSKTLFVFFLLVSLVTLGYKLFLAGVVLFLLALLHLFYPKIMIDREIEDEINWYEWD